jgi:hypothetical protein
MTGRAAIDIMVDTAYAIVGVDPQLTFTVKVNLGKCILSGIITCGVLQIFVDQLAVRK